MTDVDNDNIYDNDDDTGSAGDGNAAKTLRAQNKKLDKDLKEALGELNRFRETQRTTAIAEALRGAQAPAGLAKFAARDITGDVTADAVTAWLNENKDSFGWQPPEPEDDATAQRNDAAARISTAVGSAPAASSTLTVDRLRAAGDDDLVSLGLVDKRR